MTTNQDLELQAGTAGTLVIRYLNDSFFTYLLEYNFLKLILQLSHSR